MFHFLIYPRFYYILIYAHIAFFLHEKSLVFFYSATNTSKIKLHYRLYIFIYLVKKKFAIEKEINDLFPETVI